MLFVPVVLFAQIEIYIPTVIQMPINNVLNFILWRPLRHRFGQQILHRWFACSQI